MSVLSSTESSRPDQTQVYSGPPPVVNLQPSGRHGFFDEPRNRLFVAVIAFLIFALLLLIVVAVAFGGGGDETSDTASQPFNSATGATIAGAELEPASADVADGLVPGAPDADINPLVPESSITELDPTTTAPTTTATPTTEAPTSTTEAPTTTAPTTTAAPSTEAPTTTAPTTTAAPTTPAPTTAASVSTAPPDTPAPTTSMPATTALTTEAPTSPPPTTAAPVTQPPVVDGSVAQQILALTNAERANAGCGALSLNGQLNTAAQGHSNDMRDNDYFSHTGLNGSRPWDRATDAGYSYRTIGENIARGQRSAEQVMNGWMNSSGHRANILNCAYQDLGVGLSSSGNYWTQLFGASR